MVELLTAAREVDLLHQQPVRGDQMRVDRHNGAGPRPVLRARPTGVGVR